MTRSPRARRRATGALSGLLAVAACGHELPVRPVELRVDERVVAPRVAELRVDRDDPIELVHIAAVSDSVLVTIERRTGDLWEIALRANGARRIGNAAEGGRRRVLAMHAAGDLLSMIDAAGRITEDSVSRQPATIVAHRPPNLRRSLLGFARLPDATFVVAEAALAVQPARWFPAETIWVTRIVRPDSQVVLARWERTGANRPLGIIADFVALRSSGTAVVLSGSAPPRAAIVAAAPERLSFVEFRGVPAAPFAPADWELYRRELRRRGVPEGEIDRLPRTYPAVASAAYQPNGWFIASPAGPDRVRLLHTCGQEQVREIVGGDDLSALHLLDSGVVLVRDALDHGSMHLEFSRYSDFPLWCSR